MTQWTCWRRRYKSSNHLRQSRTGIYQPTRDWGNYKWSDVEMHRIRPYITFYFQFKSHVRVTLRETLSIVNCLIWVFISGFPWTQRDCHDSDYRYCEYSHNINPYRHLGTIDKLLHPSVDDEITNWYRHGGTYCHDVKIFPVEHL